MWRANVPIVIWLWSRSDRLMETVGVQFLDFASECMIKDYEGAIKRSLTGCPLLPRPGTEKTAH